MYSIERKSPAHVDGIKQVQVGCGPHNLLEDWWNVDIRAFKGVDEVMDVTGPWVWVNTLDYVYGEHFIEHLKLAGAIGFLQNSLNALRPGGKIRLSTPALEWVLATHFDLGSNDESTNIHQTFATNRAFHGWGHEFLYSKRFLNKLVSSVGFVDVKFYEYGQSDTPELVGMERHGGYRISGGFPSVWNVEGTRSDDTESKDDTFLQRCHDDYMRFVASGH